MNTRRCVPGNVLPVCNWQGRLTTGGSRKFLRLAHCGCLTCRLQTGSTLEGTP